MTKKNLTKGLLFACFGIALLLPAEAWAVSGVVYCSGTFDCKNNSICREQHNLCGEKYYDKYCYDRCRICADGYYAQIAQTGVDNPGNVCKQCGSHCKQCTGRYECTSCESDYILKDGWCTCPTHGHCNNGSWYCDSGYYQDLENIDCVESCPAGTYTDGSVCRSCPQHANTCTAMNYNGETHPDATSCEEGYYLAQHVNGYHVCMERCDNGKQFYVYKGQRVCLDCSKRPDYGYSFGGCDGTHVISCPDEWTKITGDINDMKDFRQICCPPHATCNLNYSNVAEWITSCDEGYKKSDDNMSCVLSGCPDGQYLSGNECKPCPQSTATCTASTALSCKRGYFLHESDFEEGKKVCYTCPKNGYCPGEEGDYTSIQCPSGTFLLIEYYDNGSRLGTYYECASCSGDINYGCGVGVATCNYHTYYGSGHLETYCKPLTCHSGFDFVTFESKGYTACVPHCHDGEFPDLDGENKCWACSDFNEGLLCDGTVNISCKDGWYLADDWENGANEDSCQKCRDNSTCIGPGDNEFTCNDGYKPENGKCVIPREVNDCPAGLKKSDDGCCCVKK